MKLLRRCCCHRAVAAIEFALAAPTLLIFLGAGADFGIVNFSRSALANAVASGAQYAFLTGPGVSGSNIKTLVQTTSFLTGVTATITGPNCYCVTGSTPTMTLQSSGACAVTPPTCTDGSSSFPAGTYIQISASYSYTSILGGDAYPKIFNMTESATMRLQ
jgi:Flp pilus assembly protein TadG